MPTRVKSKLVKAVSKPVVDPMNAQRVRWAEAALQKHGSRIEVEEPPESRLTSLLCNLRHWATANNVDMDASFVKATKLHSNELCPPRSKKNSK